MQVPSDLKKELDGNSSQAGEEQRKESSIKVMVGLLLKLKSFTKHRGLVYVLDEGLDEYPVSGMVSKAVVSFNIDTRRLHLVSFVV